MHELDELMSGFLDMISCGICGKQMANADGKWAFTTRYQNIILLVSLSLAGEIDSRQALITAESIRKAKPKMCHEHVVQAAHCMLAKMAMAGKGISYCDDPNALRSTAYVTNGDIPEDLIVVFNRMAKGSDVTITALQVSRFLNDALKRYYDTPLWPISETILMKGRRKKSEPPENPVLNTANIPSFSKTIKDEIILDGTSECSMIIEKTDPDESDYHIPVKEEIPSQSCPRCGRRLIVKQPIDVATTNVDGSICKQCSISTSPVRLWGDRVGPSGEGAYKGNVAASTAAVTTGLQYRKLERWASQLNLALFSKCFYKDISVLTKLTKRNDSWKNHTHLLPFDVKNGRTRRRRGGSQVSFEVCSKFF
ncbi:unnamed protein product [Haemonchus placei]|uniref:Uncharacterized protein n=1 Tax=Haemonchus placei TaxID=6290 RepID=A0A3P7WP55_HAEPC|nr:unnamed protein product [Haemonchus placei]